MVFMTGSSLYLLMSTYVFRLDQGESGKPNAFNKAFVNHYYCLLLYCDGINGEYWTINVSSNRPFLVSYYSVYKSSRCITELTPIISLF